jgi:hypothetical protein
LLGSRGFNRSKMIVQQIMDTHSDRTGRGVTDRGGVGTAQWHMIECTNSHHDCSSSISTWKDSSLQLNCTSCMVEESINQLRSCIFREREARQLSLKKKREVRQSFRTCSFACGIGSLIRIPAPCDELWAMQWRRAGWP